MRNSRECYYYHDNNYIYYKCYYCGAAIDSAQYKCPKCGKSPFELIDVNGNVTNKRDPDFKRLNYRGEYID